jgi:[ribosomal protein S5]-alanine N-acetyltransferase
MEIRGPQLMLRYATAGDAQDLFELGADPEVVRYFSWGPYTRHEEAAEFIERLDRERAEGVRLELLIAERLSGRPIGLTGLSEFVARDKRAFVGTWLGSRHWGTGANRESKALVLHLAFEVLGLQRVSAYANPENARSVAALQKIGFRQEGVLRNWHLHHGELLDVAIFGMLRSDWEEGELVGVPVEVSGEAPREFVF